MSLGRSQVASILRRPSATDAVLGLLLGVVFIAVPLLAAERLRRERGIDIALTGPDVAVTVVTALALTQARRRPLAVLVVTATASLVCLVAGWDVNLAKLGVAIAMFSYGLDRSRKQVVIAAAIVSVALGTTAVVVAGWGRGEWGRQDVVLWLWLATAAAIAVSSKRAAMAALEDRARRAEETREETARRRVAEDRVRIARELHDVIAHHVAVISVQSGVAEHLVDRDPVAAREAMHHVRASAKSVLTELQSVLGVLRQDESALPTAPAPGLSGLTELVGTARSMGTPVELDAPATMPMLSPAADSAGFRLVQEALTNVRKHAGGAGAVVRVATSGPSVVVTVANGPPSDGPCANEAAGGPHDRSTGSGLGLIGMRERVLAAGGSLEAGPTADGGFEVAARLPLTQDDT